MTDRSEVQRLEGETRTRGELAAARLASLVTGLLEKVETHSSVLHKDVAAAMGVTAGRVSQIMSSDGNLRIATLARLLDGFGYELSLTATPRDGQGSVITVPGPSRRQRRREPSSEVETELQQQVARLCIQSAAARPASKMDMYSLVDIAFAHRDAAELFEADTTPPARRGRRSTAWRVK